MKKIYREFVIVSVIFLLHPVLWAQTFEWANKSNTTLITTGSAIASDDHGNSYVTGSFFEKAKFGDISLSAAGRDIYVVKYDPQGKVLWANRAGAEADDFGNAIGVDKDGNCFVAGAFVGRMIIGNETLISHSQHDMFIAKYNSKGELLWCKNAGGLYSDHAMALTLDRSGNAYVAGFFKDTMLFASDKMIIGKSVGQFDFFLAKYDSKGNVVWAKTTAGANYQSQNEGLAITSDLKGMIYLTGYYLSEANFDEKKLDNRGSFAFFNAKYDSDGKNIWVKYASNLGSQIIGKGIAVDKKGNTYATGTYTSSATFDSITVEAKNLGYPEMFLAKYDAKGNIAWVRSSSGFNEKRVYAAAIDAEGNPYVIGTFRDTAIFGPITLSGIGAENVFLVKYDPSGLPKWAKQIGRHGILLGKAISIDKAGNVFMTGNFTDTADFGKAHLQTLENTQDVFVAKLSPRTVVKEKKLGEVPAKDFTFISCESDKKSAIVKFSIPKAAFILLNVADEVGNIIESFIEGERTAGVYEVKLDVKNFKDGGGYYCRLQAGKEKATKKFEIK